MAPIREQSAFQNLEMNGGRSCSESTQDRHIFINLLSHGWPPKELFDEGGGPRNSRMTGEHRLVGLVYNLQTKGRRNKQPVWRTDIQHWSINTGLSDLLRNSPCDCPHHTGGVQDVRAGLTGGIRVKLAGQSIRFIVAGNKSVRRREVKSVKE